MSNVIQKPTSQIETDQSQYHVLEGDTIDLRLCEVVQLIELFLRIQSIANTRSSSSSTT